MSHELQVLKAHTNNFRMQNGLPVSLQLPIDQFLSAFLEEQIAALPLQTGKTLEVSQLFVQVPILRY